MKITTLIISLIPTCILGMYMIELMNYILYVFLGGIPIIRYGIDDKMTLVDKKLTNFSSICLHGGSYRQSFLCYECIYKVPSYLKKNKDKEVKVIEPILSFYKKEGKSYRVWVIIDEENTSEFVNKYVLHHRHVAVTLNVFVNLIYVSFMCGLFGYLAIIIIDYFS